MKLEAKIDLWRCKRCGEEMQTGFKALHRCPDGEPGEFEAVANVIELQDGEPIQGRRESTVNPERNPERSDSGEAAENLEGTEARAGLENSEKISGGVEPARVRKTRGNLAGASGARRRRTIFDPYMPEECLDLWRLYELGARKSDGPKRSGGGFGPKPPSTDPDVVFLGWSHVQSFLAGRGVWVRNRLFAGDNLDVIASFSEWYRENPFRVVPQADGEDPGRAAKWAEDLTPMPLSEACAKLSIPVNRVNQALRRERLAMEAGLPYRPGPRVWKPKGSGPQLTTIAELESWMKMEMKS